MATEIQLETAINTANSAKSLRELSKSLRELVALQGQIGEGSADFKKLQKAINDTEGKVGDLNDSFSTLKGSGVERVNASLNLFKEGLTNADPSKLKLGLQGLGSAMKAIPIFLLVEGLTLLIENFDTVVAVMKSFTKEAKDQETAVRNLNSSFNEVAGNLEEIDFREGRLIKQLDTRTKLALENAKRRGASELELAQIQFKANEERLVLLAKVEENYRKQKEFADSQLNKALTLNDDEAYKKAQETLAAADKAYKKSKENRFNLEQDLLVEQAQLVTLSIEANKEAELQRIKNRLEANKKIIEEDRQTYAELEQMQKDANKKEAETEDIYFLSTLEKGKKEFEIEQAERQKTLDGRLDQLQTAKDKELAQVTEGSEAAYLIEKKYAELAAQERFKQIGKVLAYMQFAAGVAADINKIVTADENYNLQQMQYQKDADLENNKNRTQEQIDLETKKTNELIANENLSAAEIERIKFNSETRINQLQNDAANNELQIKQELDKQSLEIRKKQFEREKKIQLITAGINVAAAIVSALGTVQPFAAGLAAASLAAITGAVQIAAISKSKFDDGGASARQSITPIRQVDTRVAPSSNVGSNNSVGGTNPNGQLLGQGLTTNSNAIKVVVLEKDIREVANKVDVLEARSTFGV